MRTPRIAFLLVLLAGVASAQQPGSASYTPDKPNDAPTFMNAEVVRVDRASNRVTFRSESRETNLTVEGEALQAIASLHPGDKVLVGYRVSTGADGREVRYVTSVKPASPTSGEPGVRRVAANLSPGSTVRARVLSYDKRRRRVTVIDESGELRSIPIGNGVNTGLASLVPGANVAFNLGGTGTGVNVSGISSLGNTPMFANGVGFPDVSGQFVSFDPRTGAVTLDTPNAGRVTFPAGSNVTTGLSGLRPGDNLSLTFGVSTGTATGTTVPLATITGVQSLTGAPNVQAATMGGQQQMGQQQTGQQVAGQPGVTQTGVGSVGTGQAGGNASGTGGQATTGGQVVPGAVAGGPTSPLLNPVPNVRSGSPVQAAVLPPATAQAPLSAADVGTQRAQGEADLANSAVALSAAANAIDPLWAGFKGQCLRDFTAENAPAGGREWYLLAQGRILTPADDSCRALYSDLTNRAQGFMAQLDTVEDAARKADVLPVRVREVFERHRLR